jgi:hypothetical protein
MTFLCPLPLRPAGLPKAQRPTNKPVYKRKFTQEEDALLFDIVTRDGESNWPMIAQKLGTRDCRQCRERWKNYLSPSVSRSPWTPQEDALLREKYAEFGSQWCLIARDFPNRTDVNIKNRWIVLNGQSRRATKPVSFPECQIDWDEVRSGKESCCGFGFSDFDHLWNPFY